MFGKFVCVIYRDSLPDNLKTNSRNLLLGVGRENDRNLDKHFYHYGTLPMVNSDSRAVSY